MSRLFEYKVSLRTSSTLLYHVVFYYEQKRRSIAIAADWSLLPGHTIANTIVWECTLLAFPLRRFI